MFGVVRQVATIRDNKNGPTFVAGINGKIWSHGVYGRASNSRVVFVFVVLAVGRITFVVGSPGGITTLGGELVLPAAVFLFAVKGTVDSALSEINGVSQHVHKQTSQYISATTLLVVCL